MQATVEPTGALGRKMTIQVPAERIDTEVEKRLRDLSRRVRLDGFRPGKVPLRVVRQRFGRQVLHEVASELMQESYAEALQAHDLKPAGMAEFSVDSVELHKDLEFVAEFEVLPEVEPASMQGVEIRRPVVEITDQDVDHVIEKLREQRKTWVEVDRPARTGDRVTFDLEATVDGRGFEGGSGKDVVLELGGGRWVPGFDEQLEGVKAGEHKAFDLDFPEDHRNEDIAGRTVHFEVDVKKVEEPRLPDVDEAFARELGIEEGGVEELRRQVRSNMERELDEKVRADLKNQVMDALLGRNPVEVPSALLRQEIETLRRQAMEMLGVKDPAQFPDERFEEQARRRVALGLIIGAIVRERELKPDPERVAREIDRLAESYEEPELLKEYYRHNAEARREVEGKVLEDMLVEAVLEEAEVRDEPRDFQSYMG